MPAPTTPVSCSFYDVLEAAAVRRTPVVLVIGDGRGSRELHGTVEDLFSREKAEFVRFRTSGAPGASEVRLDTIRAIVDPAAAKVYRADRC